LRILSCPDFFPKTEAIRSARPQSHKNLALFPILAPETGAPDFLTLEEGPQPGPGEIDPGDPKQLATDLWNLEGKIAALRSFVWNHLIRKADKG